ncbi:MAG: hypothetical protein LUQ47_02055 [Methanotrichaceae archaeon]|nr:hypothetical protein [Methanotrichaceae archaeon]
MFICENEGGSLRPLIMDANNCKAIIYKEPEDMYGPCGCGMDMAILPVLLPKTWIVEDKPLEVEDHGFGTGLDYRRISGLNPNCVLEHQIENVEFIANFSCCRECAERASECGYAVWTDKEYPIVLK